MCTRVGKKREDKGALLKIGEFYVINNPNIVTKPTDKRGAFVIWQTDL